MFNIHQPFSAEVFNFKIIFRMKRSLYVEIAETSDFSSWDCHNLQQPQNHFHISHQNMMRQFFSPKAVENLCWFLSSRRFKKHFQERKNIVNSALTSLLSAALNWQSDEVSSFYNFMWVLFNLCSLMCKTD